MSIEEAITAAVRAALEPYLHRLAEPEPLVYSVPETAKVLRTSTNTVRRLVEDGVLPIIPHMGQRVLIPRAAVADFVASATAERRHVEDEYLTDDEATKAYPPGDVEAEFFRTEAADMAKLEDDS